MATLKEIYDGLTLLQKYNDDEKGEISAEHDELCVGSAPPTKMNPQDAAWLGRHGWNWDAKYESWRHFV